MRVRAQDPLAAVAEILLCPVCREGLGYERAVLRCSRGHSFDIARQGYVSLLTGDSRTPADSAEMVRARADFLAGGHFAPVARAVAERAAAACGAPGGGSGSRPKSEPKSEQGVILDAGAGTGHYLAAALEAAPGALGLGLDTSKYALRRAARCHPRAAAAACDLWQGLPVRDGAADAVVNVFSPRNPSEFRRVLCPGGSLVVARPTDRHLAELRQGLALVTVDAGKERRLVEGLAEKFRPREERLVEYPVALTVGEAADAVLMGPTARHLTAEAVVRALTDLAAEGALAVTVSVVVSAYRAT